MIKITNLKIINNEENKIYKLTKRQERLIAKAIYDFLGTDAFIYDYNENRLPHGYLNWNIKVK